MVSASTHLAILFLIICSVATVTVRRVVIGEDQEKSLVAQKKPTDLTKNCTVLKSWKIDT